MSQSLKQTADKIMAPANSKAKIIGVVFETFAQYIKQKQGPEGLAALEKKMASLGYPFDLEKIKTFEYYPLSLSILVLASAKEVFNWTDKNIFEMGYNTPQFSLFVRIWMRHFMSLEKIVKEAPNNWKKHFTEGKLEYELNEDKKYLILKITHNAIHPLTCIYAQGYFLRIFKYAIKSDKVKIEETKCMLKGGPYHEYVITWR